MVKQEQEQQLILSTSTTTAEGIGTGEFNAKEFLKSISGENIVSLLVREISNLSLKNTYALITSIPNSEIKKYVLSKMKALMCDFFISLSNTIAEEVRDRSSSAPTESMVGLIESLHSRLASLKSSIPINPVMKAMSTYYWSYCDLHNNETEGNKTKLKSLEDQIYSLIETLSIRTEVSALLNEFVERTNFQNYNLESDLTLFIRYKEYEILLRLLDSIVPEAKSAITPDETPSLLKRSLHTLSLKRKQSTLLKKKIYLAGIEDKVSMKNEKYLKKLEIKQANFELKEKNKGLKNLKDRRKDFKKLEKEIGKRREKIDRNSFSIKRTVYATSSKVSQGLHKSYNITRKIRSLFTRKKKEEKN